MGVLRADVFIKVARRMGRVFRCITITIARGVLHPQAGHFHTTPTNDNVYFFFASQRTLVDIDYELYAFYCVRYILRFNAIRNSQIWIIIIISSTRINLFMWYLIYPTKCMNVQLLQRTVLMKEIKGLKYLTCILWLILIF